jgi:hypothetical protein
MGDPMKGSLRQRSAGSWELRVYIGTDPATGRRLDRTATVRGNRSDAERELAAMVASVDAVRAVGVRSTVGELLEAWFAIAATGWAPTTIRQTCSVLDRYLRPHVGAVPVGDVTAAMIDATYAELRRHGGVGRRPLAAARWLGCTSSCKPRSPRRCAGAGSGTTLSNAPTGSSP